MARRITQRQLRNESGAIMRGLDRGEEFLVTRNGVPVGELRPLQRRRSVGAQAAVDAFVGAEPIDIDGFRDDLDLVVDQDPRPRV